MSFLVGVGTGNPHKLHEFHRILSPLVPGLELVPVTGEGPEETGLSFQDNALIKARAAFLQTGLPSIADDSGITVRALGGAPGIYSQRYSPSGTDHENTALLLTNMTGERDRSAAFVCAAALVFDGGEKVIERSWQGSLATTERGSKGFGYDPVFIPEGLEVTSAELSPSEKDDLSHRGQAFRDLAPYISGVLG